MNGSSTFGNNLEQDLVFSSAETKDIVGIEVLIVSIMKNTVLRDVMPCSLV